MAKKKRSRKRRLVLDMGASAIRLCELTPTKTGYQLSKYYQRDVVFDPAGDEEERKTARANVLKELLKEAKVRSKKTIIGVPGQSVFTRPRPLPPVPEHKVTQIVRYEIQQQIPFPLDQIALDYQVLDRTEGGGYYVLMAAIKVDIVERNLDILKGVKRSPDVVDVCPLAAYNWLKSAGEFGDQGECVALVDLGAATTDIVIERDNQFRWNRPLSLGGNDITKAIADEFGVSFEEAERLKRERAFAPTGDPQRDGKAGEVVGRVLSRLVSEITRSFSYYRSQPGGGPVSRVVVTGGGACLRNIIPYLQRQLGMEVRIAQPLAGLAIGPGAQEVNEHPEQSAVVLGLALRACESVPIEINLIPPRIREASRRKEQVLYWSLSIATLVVIMASTIPVRANEHKVVLERIDEIKSFLLQYDPRMRSNIEQRNVGSLESEYESELNGLKQRIQSYSNLVAVLDQTRTDRVQWLDFLNAINEARPTEKAMGVWIASLETSFIGQQQGARAASAKNARAGGGQAPAIPSSGFQGITTGSGNFSERGGGLPSGKGQERQVQAPPRPNGFVIKGYASDPDAVLTFKENLQKSGLFIEGGIYLDERDVIRVDASELFNANVTHGGGGSAPASGGYGAAQGQRQTVISFRIDAQYAGQAFGAKPEGGGQGVGIGGFKGF